MKFTLIAAIMFLGMLACENGYGQNQNILQFSNEINKIDSLEQRVGQWIEYYGMDIYSFRNYNHKGRYDGVFSISNIGKDKNAD